MCTVSEEKRLITDGDHVYETIRFENLSIAALSKEFGMTRVRLEIDLIASEVDDGYQDIWIHREAGTADGDNWYLWFTQYTITIY